MPVFSCPSDSRTLQPADFKSIRIGLTSYLGVEGLDALLVDGVLYLDSHVSFADIRDGASNTLLVGERPPSPDLKLGWWYAGSGKAQNGTGDSVLGVLESNGHFRYPQCPSGPSQYGPGSVTNDCDTFHFWSLHFGGSHFLFCDGSVRLLAYSAAPVLPALATRADGDVVGAFD